MTNFEHPETIGSICITRIVDSYYKEHAYRLFPPDLPSAETKIDDQAK